MIEESFGNLCPVCGTLGELVSTSDLPLDTEHAETSYRLVRKYRCTSCDDPPALWVCTMDVSVKLVE